MKIQTVFKKVVFRTSIISAVIATTLSHSSENSWQSANGLWSEVDNQTRQELTLTEPQYKQSVLQLDIDQLASDLLAAPFYDHTVGSRLTGGVKTKLPLPSGELVEFFLFESPVLASELGKKYPSIKTYFGYQVGNPDNRGRFDITPKGFHGMFKIDGQRFFIDPLRKGDSHYRIYNAKDALDSRNERPADQVITLRQELNQTISHVNRRFDFGTDLRTYRLAVSAAGEYTQFHGGTVELALAEITTAINRVNEIYETDVAIRFTIVADNDQIIFTDPDTDPFSNTSSDINANEAVIDGAIGNDNYDIGHIFNTGGGGLAGLGVVCGSRKADGVTGLNSPENDVFYIDYVAHEIGHQFGANHTFNGGTGSCSGGNRAGSAAFEPGSGSTIMAYAGICGEQNIQNNSDAFFHSHSIDEIRTYITASTGASCGTDSSLSNQIPTVDAGADFVIPASTPFTLTGSGSDADSGDLANLTYSWEQMDLGPQTSSQADMIDDGQRPLFRTFLPTESATRVFPELNRVVNGTSSYDQVLPTTNRTMDFRLTVRDNRGGVKMDTMTVTVDNTAGPFTVPALPDTGPFDGAETATVNWNVANTDAASVNCASVNIILSADGGVTFDDTLLADTANDGSATVTMPNSDISDARIKVECSDGRFFNVSPTSFAVIASFGVPVIEDQVALTMVEDDSITLSLDDITVSDENSTFPDDFTLNISAGADYTFDGLTVTPEQDFDGELTVNISVFDGEFDSPIFPLLVNVTPVNDAPVISAAGQSVSVLEDETVTLTLDLLNVTDVDSSEFSLEIVEGDDYSSNGQILIPDENFAGLLDVGVRVNDGELDSNTEIITVVVNAVNDAPVAVNDEFTVEQGSKGNVFTPLSNDTDVDAGSILDISSINYSGEGSLEISAGNRTLEYTPRAGFNGTETFQYTIRDNGGATSTATVTVTVNKKPSSGGGSINLWFGLIALLMMVRRRP